VTIQADETQTTLAVAKQLYDAVSAADLDGVLACLSEDVVVREPSFLPYGGVYRGIDDFSRMFPMAAELLDVTQLRVDRLVASGDRVVSILRIRERATGEDVVVAEESRIAAGKIVELTVYYHDTQSMLRA
jgi:uncharacterized protein